MERAQRILKKFSKILKEQGAGPLFTTFKGYVTYALYDRWKVRRLRKFPPRMVKNRILFETNDDFTDNCRALFDYMVANGYNKKYELVWLVHEPEKYKKYQAENVKFVRNFKINVFIQRLIDPNLTRIRSPVPCIDYYINRVYFSGCLLSNHLT